MRKKEFIKILVFLLFGAVLLSVLNGVVTSSGDYRIHQFYGSFYAEKKGSLDAVYLGASTTYAFWEAPLAWDRYGIAVHPLSSPNQPLEAEEFLIREARKTQPDALYIVPITSANDSLNNSEVHHLLDYMPLSWNKVQLVQTLGGYMGLSFSEQLEYLFPFIRFHGRWSELEKRDFYNPLDGLKGSSYYTNFLKTSKDVSSGYKTTEKTAPISSMTQTALDSLLAYCDEEQVKVLFVAVPGAKASETRLAQMNTIKEIVQERGYPILDLRFSADEIGLDMTKDYYNENHTNIHGAVKVTDYIARYLVENYGFTDKRGDPAYSSWDAAYEKYAAQYVTAYTLDVEWQREARDLSLAAPQLSQVNVEGGTLTVSWDAVEGADGYRIYGKTATGKSWQALDTVGADVLSYSKTGFAAGSTYIFTVIAYRDEDGTRVWGDYDFTGVKGTALLEAPEILSLEGGDSGVTLTWNAVEGADLYRIYRKLPGEDWAKLVDVENVTAYTDTTVQPGTAYLYRVRGVYLDSEGSKKYGSYDLPGSLYLPELALPQVSLEMADGVPQLSWSAMQGINGYKVFRRTETSDWWQLCSNLPDTSTSFRDIVAQAGATYFYKVVPYISYNEETYSFECLPVPESVKVEKTVNPADMAKIRSAEQIGNKICLAWEPAANVSQYGLYRRALREDGTWSAWEAVLTNIQEHVCLDQPPEAGEYQYGVRVFYAADGLTYYGNLNAAGAQTVSYR